MLTQYDLPNTVVSRRNAPAITPPRALVEVGLLTGCQDRPYAFGLAMALVSKGVRLDVIGSDEVDSPELHATQNLRFLNFRGSQQRDSTLFQKLRGLLIYYARLIWYTSSAKAQVIHILWNNKFEYFDRTLLMLYYKVWGKKVALTAHNINQGRRDSNDSFLNRLTLRIQYRLADHIFVHTQKMKNELLEDFGVQERAVTVIRHPINNAFPDTDLTSAEAKRRLGIRDDERTILFFGRIRPYKGLEYLLAAFKVLAASHVNYRLVIAGEPKKGSEGYLEEIRRTIKDGFSAGQIILKVQFIPDQEMELYLKSADVLVLPYKEIFQSGVLFLGYSFGLPVVATDVGSFREEIVEGRTGFLCKPGDPADLAKALETYFESDLYRDLGRRRREIREYAYTHHSWDAVAQLTRNAYAELSGGTARETFGINSNSCV
jgi:D-inositol-3-phosphate glycosyltransferase